MKLASALLTLAFLCISIPLQAAPSSRWIVQSGHKTDDLGEGMKVVWSPNGKWLATATVRTGQLFVRLPNGSIWARHRFDGRLNALTWSADSQWLALATDSGLKIYAMADANFLDLHQPPLWMRVEGQPRNIGFLTESRLVVYLESPKSPQEPSQKRSLWIWDFQTNQKTLVSRSFDATGLRGFRVSPDYNSFAVSTDANLKIYGDDGAVRLSFPTPRPPEFEDRGSICGVGNLQFSPDGQWLAGVELDSGFTRWYKWNLPRCRWSEGYTKIGIPMPKIYALDNDGKLLWRLRTTLSGLMFEHKPPELPLGINENAPQYANKNGVMLVPLNSALEAGAVTYSYDEVSQHLAIGTVFGDVAILDTVRGDVLQRQRGAKQWANTVAFSPDGAHLCIGYGQEDFQGSRGEMAVFALRDSHLERSLSAHFDASGADFGVTDALFSPDGKWLISTGRLKDGTAILCVFDAHTLRLIRHLTINTPRAWRMAWSSDGKALVVGTEGGYLLLWKDFERVIQGNINPDWRGTIPPLHMPSLRATSERPQSSIAPNSLVEAIAISPDKRFVLAGGQNRMLNLFDFASGKQLRNRPLHTEVYDVAWARDGQTFWTATANGEIAQWNTHDLQKRATLYQSNVVCATLALSPDEKTLYAGSDNQVLAFALPEGQVMRQMDGGSDGDYYYSLQLSRDGAWLAGASEDGTATLWDAHTGQIRRVFHRLSATRDGKGQLKTEAAVLDGKGSLLFRTSPLAVLWRDGNLLLPDKTSQKKNE